MSSKSVKIPKDLARKIDDEVVGYYGYKSRTAFILEAIKEHLDKVRSNPPTSRRKE